MDIYKDNPYISRIIRISMLCKRKNRWWSKAILSRYKPNIKGRNQTNRKSKSIFIKKRSLEKSETKRESGKWHFKWHARKVKYKKSINERKQHV